MALVGPGPVTEDHVVRWGGVLPDFARRFVVKPGLTGLAQISNVRCDDAEGIARRAQYDLYYVEHRSLLLDIRTLFRTVAILFRAARRWAPASAPAARSREGAVPAPALPAVYPPATPPAVKGVTR
jgi:lipopolysaccharide/colanic/teichoic acid biosynthesis glycosyltransferase